LQTVDSAAGFLLLASGCASFFFPHEALQAFDLAAFFLLLLLFLFHEALQAFDSAAFFLLLFLFHEALQAFDLAAFPSLLEASDFSCLAADFFLSSLVVSCLYSFLPPLFLFD